MPQIITANAAYHFGLDEAAYTFCCMIARVKKGAPARPLFALPPGFAAPEGYTSLDIPLQIGPLHCESLSGLLPKAIPMSVGLETAGVEATLLFQEVGGISRELVNAGAYRGAIVTVFAAPWEALLTGAATDADCVPLLRGRFGGAPDLLDEAVTLELLPLSSLAGTQVGRMTSGFCDCSRFGRDRCFGELGDGVNISLYGRTVGGHIVAAPVGESSFGLQMWLQLDQARATGWADHGVLRMMGGELEGAEFAVKRWEGGGRVLLRTPIGIMPDVGTRIEMEEGCERTLIACLGKEPNPDAPTGRGNTPNYMGFDSPGQTKYVKQKTGKRPAKFLEGS